MCSPKHHFQFQDFSVFWKYCSVYPVPKKMEDELTDLKTFKPFQEILTQVCFISAGLYLANFELFYRPTLHLWRLVSIQTLVQIGSKVQKSPLPTIRTKHTASLLLCTFFWFSFKSDIQDWNGWWVDWCDLSPNIFKCVEIVLVTCHLWTLNTYNVWCVYWQ